MIKKYKKYTIIFLLIIILIIFIIILNPYMNTKEMNENYYKSEYDYIDNEDDNDRKYTKHNYIHSNRTRRPKQYYEKI